MRLDRWAAQFGRDLAQQLVLERAQRTQLIINAKQADATQLVARLRRHGLNARAYGRNKTMLRIFLTHDAARALLAKLER